MPISEFVLIEKYFNTLQQNQLPDHVCLGIGDDAAVLQVPEQHQLVVTIDTLVAGRHFPAQTKAEDIAYKSLAVNVSDLAAMGAQPAYFVLSLTMPDADEHFVQCFSKGLHQASKDFDIPLVGGDTCKGPLSITIQASGYIPENLYITRAGAKPGDRIYVSGALGSAAVGLAHLNEEIDLDENQIQTALQALNRPVARIDLTDILREHATSALDLSDGLIGDLAHILHQSGVGAELYKERIPVFDWINYHDAYDYALTGGDDYEMLFTVAKENIKALQQEAEKQHLTLYEIGIIKDKGYFLLQHNERIDLTQHRGFDHFAS